MDLLESSFTPPKFLTTQDEEAGHINAEFAAWEQQNQLLVSWLLSSMSESVLTRMVGCETSTQIWTKLNSYFASHTRAKISQFKTVLQNIKKGSLNMNEYLSKVKNIVDRLASVGHTTSESDHIEFILNGLLESYDTFIVSVNSRSESYSIEEIESLLLAQEMRIEKYTKELDSNTGSLNAVTHANMIKKQNRGNLSHNVTQSLPIITKVILNSTEEGISLTYEILGEEISIQAKEEDNHGPVEVVIALNVKFVAKQVT